VRATIPIAVLIATSFAVGEPASGQEPSFVSDASDAAPGSAIVAASRFQPRFTAQKFVVPSKPDSNAPSSLLVSFQRLTLVWAFLLGKRQSRARAPPLVAIS
jgi:hypothetical protein